MSRKEKIEKILFAIVLALVFTALVFVKLNELVVAGIITLVSGVVIYAFVYINWELYNE